MKQSATESLALWSVLAVVFGVTYGIGSIAGVQSDDSELRAVSPAAFEHVYPGPSNDYSVAPSTDSLTYSDDTGNTN